MDARTGCSGGRGISPAIVSSRAPCPAGSGTQHQSKPTGVIAPAGSPWVVFTFTAASSSAGVEVMRAAFPRPPLSMTTILPQCGPQTTEAGRGEFFTARFQRGICHSPASRYCRRTRTRAGFLPRRTRPHRLTLTLRRGAEQSLDGRSGRGCGRRSPSDFAGRSGSLLPKPVAASCVTVMVREVKSGHARWPSPTWTL